MAKPIPFHGINLDSLNQAWRKFYPERYGIDTAMLAAKTVEHPLLDWGCSLAVLREGEVSSFVAVKKSAAPHLFNGPDPDQAHITALAFDDPCEMVDLLATVKSALRQRGVYRLHFGADHGHLFPGVPVDCPNLRNFLEIEGFEFEEKDEVDIQRDLGSYEPPPWVKPALDSVTIRRADHRDLVPLEQFMHGAFPGRWQFDVMTRAVRQGRPQDICIMEVDGSLQGFALIEDSSGVIPIGGGVWRESLGANWGALGPIGIGREVRGRKLGHAMLAGALLELQKAGVRECIIDWTTLVDFYGAHGFEICHRYNYTKLDLR